MVKPQFWLVGLGSHMPVIPGDILDMPGAPEPVRLTGIHGDQARVTTTGGDSMVDFATVGIVRADKALCRSRPIEGPLDHREHRLGALSGDVDEAIFYLLWTSFDGITPPAVNYFTEPSALIAYVSCCTEPSNLTVQLVRRRAGVETVVAAFDRRGLQLEPMRPHLTAV